MDNFNISKIKNNNPINNKYSIISEKFPKLVNQSPNKRQLQENPLRKNLLKNLYGTDEMNYNNKINLKLIRKRNKNNIYYSTNNFSGYNNSFSNSPRNINKTFYISKIREFFNNNKYNSSAMINRNNSFFVTNPEKKKKKLKNVPQYWETKKFFLCLNFFKSLKRK